MVIMKNSADIIKCPYGCNEEMTHKVMQCVPFQNTESQNDDLPRGI